MLAVHRQSWPLLESGPACTLGWLAARECQVDPAKPIVRMKEIWGNNICPREQLLRSNQKQIKNPCMYVVSLSSFEGQEIDVQ